MVHTECVVETLVDQRFPSAPSARPGPRVRKEVDARRGAPIRVQGPPFVRPSFGVLAPQKAFSLMWCCTFLEGV
eukprot:gene14133-biopygen2047